MLINKLFRKMIKKIFRRTKTNYKIDDFCIELSKGHMLPEYQEEFCYYDKIIPFLVNVTDNNSDNSWIIDIGANVGDTLYAMLRHTNANFLCLEPDKDFFQLLEKNVSTLDIQYKNRIKCINAFVGLDSLANLVTEKQYGTAHKVVVDVDSANSGNLVPTKTLKELLEINAIDLDQVSLIKVDTDGYDWECIMSIGKDLFDKDIVLYWKHYLDKGNEIQLTGSYDLANYLTDMGYTTFFCFDNFGNYISSGNADFLNDMTGYLYRLNENKTARTMYYIDVLACKKDKVQNMQNMIENFYKVVGEKNA